MGTTMRKILLSLWLLVPWGLHADDAKPLFDAINSNELAAVVTLLKSGADVNARKVDYMNATPLMMAMGKNNLEMTRVLVEAGADVNLIDENGDPAINWAAYYGLTQQVTLLLGYGASTQMVGHGNTIEIAMRRGHQELVKVLAQHDGVAVELTPAVSDLQDAIDAGDSQAVEQAISNGAPANGMDETGRPLIARAARTGSVEIVLLLKDNGADIDAMDAIGFTPLMEVARKGDTRMAAVLIKADANPKHVAFKRGLSFTPLHQAAVGGNLEILGLLLNANAGIDSVDSIGNTPAMWSLYEGNLDFCLAVLEAGSDPSIKNESNMSLASTAREYQVKRIITWLDENGQEES